MALTYSDHIVAGLFGATNDLQECIAGCWVIQINEGMYILCIHVSNDIYAKQRYRCYGDHLSWRLRGIGSLLLGL